MEGQSEQSYQVFENHNQNSACLLPGKLDLMGPGDNGLLSYEDNGEIGDEDTADLLSEKQFSEISSVLEMTTSSSNDTGFGSATVSEITTPVENNETATKPLTENAEIEAKGENCESMSVSTANQIEILPNEKADSENDVSAEHKVEGDTNVEEVAINTNQDESVELATHTNEEHKHKRQLSDGKGDESVVESIPSKAEDQYIEKIEQKETEDQSVEEKSTQETEGESAEKTAEQELKEIKHENVEKTLLQVTETESFQKTAQQEKEVKSAQKAVLEEAEVETIAKTSYKETNSENVQHSVIEDESSKKLENGKADDNAESKETSSTEEASHTGDDVNIEKTNDKLEPNLPENVEQEVQNTKSAATNEPEAKSPANLEHTKADYEVKETNTHKPAGDGNIYKTEDNVVENRDVKNKSTEESAINANNNLAESENAEKLKSKQADEDYDVINSAGYTQEDKQAENVTVDNTGEEGVDVLTHTQAREEAVKDVLVDKPQDENVTSNNAENNSQEDVVKKIDNENLQHAEADAEDKKAADEEEEQVMDILGNGLLKKKVLVPGRGVETRPTNGEIVTVKVDGQLPEGTHVDTGEITFSLNDGDVILAFDLAVALMEEGETCELFTSERYAYGSLGRDPDIPKSTSITYVLELISVQKPPAVSELSYDQRLKMGEAKRERGNFLFGRGDYSGAINSYNRAVKLLDNPELNEGIDESYRGILTESSVKCYNNLAASQLKIDALDAAIKSCERVLSVQEDNVKALFRLGKAYGAKGDVDQALTNLRRAVRLDPESKLMQQEMLNLTRRKNKEAATEKELYQRMLGVKPGAKPVSDEDSKRSSSFKVVKWTLLAGGVAAVLISVGLSWYRAS